MNAKLKAYRIDWTHPDGFKHSAIIKGYVSKDELLERSRLDNLPKEYREGALVKDLHESVEEIEALYPDPRVLQSL